MSKILPIVFLKSSESASKNLLTSLNQLRHNYLLRMYRKNRNRSRMKWWSRVVSSCWKSCNNKKRNLIMVCTRMLVKPPKSFRMHSWPLPETRQVIQLTKSQPKLRRISCNKTLNKSFSITQRALSTCRLAKWTIAFWLKTSKKRKIRPLIRSF